jgi:hypothetical protein
VVRVDGHRSFAHMDETLSDPDHEQVVGVLGMVLSQLEIIIIDLVSV